MTYVNPVLAYGLERFVADAAAAGASGLLLTDFPAVADPRVEAVVAASPLALIRLIAPTTTAERLAHAVGGGASGFLYLISRPRVTRPWDSGSAPRRRRAPRPGWPTAWWSAARWWRRWAPEGPARRSAWCATSRRRCGVREARRDREPAGDDLHAGARDQWAGAGRGGADRRPAGDGATARGAAHAWRHDHAARRAGVPPQVLLPHADPARGARPEPARGCARDDARGSAGGARRRLAVAEEDAPRGAGQPGARDHRSGRRVRGVRGNAAAVGGRGPGAPRRARAGAVLLWVGVLRHQSAAVLLLGDHPREARARRAPADPALRVHRLWGDPDRERHRGGDRRELAAARLAVRRGAAGRVGALVQAHNRRGDRRRGAEQDPRDGGGDHQQCQPGGLVRPHRAAGAPARGLGGVPHLRPPDGGAARCLSRLDRAGGARGDPPRIPG